MKWDFNSRSHNDNVNFLTAWPVGDKYESKTMGLADLINVRRGERATKFQSLYKGQTTL